MDINAVWQKQIKLIEGREQNLLYYWSEEKISENPGCDVFYNKHGSSISILYIGSAKNLRSRLAQQQNNVKLMMGIKNSFKKGDRFLITCTVNLKQGQKSDKVIKLLEDNLIKIALTSGHELINIHGTKIKYEHITFKGNRDSEKMFDRKVSIEKKNK